MNIAEQVINYVNLILRPTLYNKYVYIFVHMYVGIATPTAKSDAKL